MSFPIRPLDVGHCLSTEDHWWRNKGFGLLDLLAVSEFSSRIDSLSGIA